MRYLNRRSLVIVVFFAALLGAVLPYLQLIWFWQTRPRLIHGIATPLQSGWEMHEEYRVRETLLFKPDIAGMTESMRAELTARYGGVLNQQTFDALAKGNLVMIEKIGWPFRAAYLTYTVHRRRQTIELGDSAFAFSSAPPTQNSMFFPKGVLWLGVLENIASTVTIAIAASCTIAFIRSRKWGRQPGECWKCGYLVGSTAVCPECGIAQPGMVNTATESSDTGRLSL